MKTGGVWYQDTYTVAVENSSWSWNINEFDSISGGSGATVAATFLQNAKYEGIAITGEWTGMFFQAIMRGSIIYVNSHGSPLHHVAGNFIDESGDSIDALQSENYNYVTGRIGNNGSGLPPMNTMFPPVNLLLLEVCCAGATLPPNGQGYFATALYPFGNVYAPNSFEDQAVHAYTVFTRTADSEISAEALVGKLVEGKSIVHASTYLIANAEDLDIQCSDTEGGANRYMSLVTDRAIFGDTATRIKNVYTGLTGNSNSWFREL